MYLRTSRLIAVTLLTLSAALRTEAQTVITEWDFDGANSTSIPGGANGPAPSTGIGTALLVGNVVSPGFNNGYTGSCSTTDGSCGWQTNTYPEQSLSSGTAGIEFRVSTVGFKDIVFEYAHRASGTSSRWARIEYMTDGCIWNVLGDNGGALTPHDTYHDFSFDLSGCEECNNNPDFRVRIVSIFSPFGFSDLGNTYSANEAYQQARNVPTVVNQNYTGSTGTWRFDNVSVKGIPASHTVSTGEPTGVPVCVGESISIPYTATGAYITGNVFTAQLSDEFGCFSEPVDIGSVSSTTSGTIDADVPFSTIAGTGYRVRVIASTPLVHGVPNDSPFSVQALPTVIANASESVLCAGEPTVLTGGGASIYVWDSGAVNGQSTVPSGTTIYTVKGTGVNGCENTASVQVTVNPLPTVAAQVTESVLCAGENTVLTGGGAVSYVWDNGAEDGTPISPSSSTTYTVTGTDGNGCESTASVDVTVNALPAVNANASETSLCQGESTVLTGSGALTYIWDNGAVNGETIVPTGSTTFTVTGTDDNGCQNTATVELTVNPLPEAIITASGPTSFCEGNSVTLSTEGGVSYLWSTGSSSPSILVAEEGDFTVAATDDNGCVSTSAVVSVTILEIPIADVTFSGPLSFCEGGAVTLTAADGSGHQWDNGAQTQEITVTQSGTFSVTLTDVNGCTAESEDVEVTVFPAATVEVVASGPTTFCQGGQVTLSASGAANFLWNDGQNTQTVTVSSTADLSVTVTDDNGCSATSNAVAVTVNPLPEALINASGLLVCPGEEVTLTASGAAGHLWSNGADAQSINVDQGGTYTVTVTDANGCVATSEAVEITQGTGAQAELSVSGDLEFCIGGSVTLSVTPQGEFTGIQWSNGSTAGSITVNSSGEYAVTVSGEGSCFGETQQLGPVTVNVLSELPVVEQTDDLLTVVNGPFASYQWFRNGSPIPGAAASSYQFTTSGNYYVRVTGEGGCVTQSMNFEVTVNVSVEELINGETAVFPNPTHGMLNIKLSQPVGSDISVRILDMSGRLQMTETLHPTGTDLTAFALEVSQLPSGVFVVEISAGDVRTTRRFVRW